ncbi:MAG: hypothetical protein PHF67_02350 [Candidatus Nanoarchaeia archaeon]|nr:hypothetical protein [Candidatus Nanoarchaeia archaeon]
MGWGRFEKGLGIWHRLNFDSVKQGVNLNKKETKLTAIPTIRLIFKFFEVF